MSESDANGWLDISTAPKDGSRMLWAGKWKPFDILPGGEWTQQIFNWGSVMSDGTGYCWMSENFFPPDHWHVVWTHWRPLPAPPISPRRAE
jgi:hypothetical protein